LRSAKRRHRMSGTYVSSGLFTRARAHVHHHIARTMHANVHATYMIVVRGEHTGLCVHATYMIVVRGEHTSLCVHATYMIVVRGEHTSLCVRQRPAVKEAKERFRVDLISHHSLFPRPWVLSAATI
jgi:hypothetical protein